MRVLKPGGVAIFQVPSRCLTSDIKHHESPIETPLGVATIDMNVIPMHEVLKIVEDRGGILVDVQEDGAAGPAFVSHTYCVVKQRFHRDDRQANVSRRIAEDQVKNSS